MLESFKGNQLEYQKLSPEEMQKRGILGRLEGVIADYSNPTRNGRLYGKDLWQRVFDDPIMKERINNRCLFGELGHPENRLETDMEKIAVCMAEQPKMSDDGRIYGIFDILDTNCGKILKTLCDYGCKIGISSRGNGETTTDFDGNESVIPETYECYGWDCVIVPGVEAARLNYVTEGLGNKTLKQALNESLNSAAPKDRKVMEETLQRLNIDYSDAKASNNITTIAAKDNGAIVKTLQESLLAKEKAETKITELQEKLSVCYAKEARYEENIVKYKETIRNLSEKLSNANKLQSKYKTLAEELENKQEELIKEQRKVENLEKKQELTQTRQTTLRENLSSKETQLSKANQLIESLTERIKVSTVKHSQERERLTESYENLKKDYAIKQTEYSNKLSNANRLVEQYRDTAKKAVDKYISIKSLNLGVNAQQVKNRLPENYSFKDIDTVCENLSNYNLQMNDLPFNLKSVKKVSITESKKLPGTQNSDFYDGDLVDDDLIRLATNLSTN